MPVSRRDARNWIARTELRRIAQPNRLELSALSVLEPLLPLYAVQVITSTGPGLMMVAIGLLAIKMLGNKARIRRSIYTS